MLGWVRLCYTTFLFLPDEIKPYQTKPNSLTSPNVMHPQSFTEIAIELGGQVPHITPVVTPMMRIVAFAARQL